MAVSPYESAIGSSFYTMLPSDVLVSDSVSAYRFRLAPSLNKPSALTPPGLVVIVFEPVNGFPLPNRFIPSAPKIAGIVGMLVPAYGFCYMP